MDISYTLIVALMFITILSFGLANLLSSLAEILNNKSNLRLSDEHWERIRDHYPEEYMPPSRPGRKPISTRKVLESVL